MRCCGARRRSVRRRANIAAMMANPDSQSSEGVRLLRDLQILKFNISALRSLVYFDKFFGTADAANLDRAENVLASQIIPALKTKPVDSSVAEKFQDIRNSMYDATGTAIAASRALSETADIEDGARSNFLLAALLVTLLIFVSSVGLILVSSQRRHTEFLKSFSSLHVHATRSRLEALRLFIRRMNGGEETSRSMKEAAERAADELSAINESLLHIAATTRPKERVPLWSVLQLLSDAHPGFVRQEIADEASKASVASPHMYMILDELVENARRALEAAGRRAHRSSFEPGLPQISGSGKPWRSRSSTTASECPRGPGGGAGPVLLNPGRPACRPGADGAVTRCFGPWVGTLRILSTEGHGTTVKISYPLQNLHVRQELVNESASKPSTTAAPSPRSTG